MSIGPTHVPQMIKALRPLQPATNPKLFQSFSIHDPVPLVPGGYYQSYLYNQCPGSTILTVESNPTVVAAARDFFGFEGEMGRLGECTS